MKLKFKNQDFQTDAVNAVCDLFLGQEKRYSSFEISKNVSNLLLQNEFGIGNAKFISDDRILENMNKIDSLRKAIGLNPLMEYMELNDIKFKNDR